MYYLVKLSQACQRKFSFINFNDSRIVITHDFFAVRDDFLTNCGAQHYFLRSFAYFIHEKPYFIEIFPSLFQHVVTFINH